MDNIMIDNDFATLCEKLRQHEETHNRTGKEKTYTSIRLSEKQKNSAWYREWIKQKQLSKEGITLERLKLLYGRDR